MSDDVVLPDLATLRRRWNTLASGFQQRGVVGVWMSSPATDSYLDASGSRMDLAQFGPALAVVTAWDAELSDATPEHPLDFFGSAPFWVPRIPLVPNAPLGDLVWFENGKWSRSPGLRGVPRAVEVLATPLLDDESVAAELAALPAVVSAGKTAASTLPPPPSGATPRSTVPPTA